MSGSFKLDFDSFVEKFENDLDCIYTETGSNYDTETENIFPESDPFAPLGTYPG